MLSLLGELGSDEEILDLLLLLDEAFSSFLAEKKRLSNSNILHTLPN